MLLLTIKSAYRCRPILPEPIPGYIVFSREAGPKDYFRNVGIATGTARP
jgi:hypothetical protein